jgi:hypothetical protein
MSFSSNGIICQDTNKMAIAYICNGTANTTEDKEMPASLEFEADEDECLLPAPMKRSAAGGLSEIQLASVTAEMHAFQCKNGLSKDAMKTLLDKKTILRDRHTLYFLRCELEKTLLHALPDRAGATKDNVLHAIRLRYLPVAECIAIPITVKVAILLHYRELVTNGCWSQLERAIGQDAELPANIRENTTRVSAGRWLRRCFLGFDVVKMRKSSTAPNHDWLTHEVVELEVLWHEQLLKDLKRHPTKLHNSNSQSYSATDDSWDVIGKNHSSRTACECKAFWHAVYRF